MDEILVVKLGGSCASSPDFNRWLQAIEKATRPIVLVPGGGPFANTVRRYQPRLGYDDAAAHHMAILAMEQFGWALVSLGQRLVPAASREAVKAALAEGRIPVWMPAATALAAPEIAQDWTVTSDSLAAWLAASLPGASLLLVKQIDVPADVTLEALAGAEIVDPSFLAMLHPDTTVSVAGPADLVLAGHQFADGAVPGHAIAAERRMAVAAE
ncbi:amino acid kinase [Aureimonas sp. Leaf454]|uniref:amino acid kinase family protein n=1 Tax=Aureimonas sp. Leaf454 TaxID=1736381 RepID=UPI0006F948A7|nr:amino acid kinase [Aureimonas sp. Leaf454]KQT47510.1 amino acid kinase [Aureimonas sp. Leaf454]